MSSPSVIYKVEEYKIDEPYTIQWVVFEYRINGMPRIACQTFISKTSAKDFCHLMNEGHKDRREKAEE